MELHIEIIPAKPVQTERVFTLTLSEDEARFLLDVCRMIGGDPKTTRRRHSDRVIQLLQEEGKVVPSTNRFERCPDAHPVHRSIHFV